jgi:hypothetical protein
MCKKMDGKYKKIIEQVLEVLPAIMMGVGALVILIMVLTTGFLLFEMMVMGIFDIFILWVMCRGI